MESKKLAFIVVEKEESFGGDAASAGEAKKLCTYCKGSGFIVEPKVPLGKVPCAKCARTGFVKA